MPVLINNAWGVIRVSLVTWLSQILGWAMVVYAYVNTSNTDIQTTLHFAAWSQWVPWVIGLATAFGIPISRGVKQQSVTNATNK